MRYQTATGALVNGHAVEFSDYPSPMMLSFMVSCLRVELEAISSIITIDGWPLMPAFRPFGSAMVAVQLRKHSI